MLIIQIVYLILQDRDLPTHDVCAAVWLQEICDSIHSRREVPELFLHLMLHGFGIAFIFRYFQLCIP